MEKHLTVVIQEPIKTFTHENNKPFKCEVCKTGFSGKDHLNVHMRIHLNEKPFKCQICEKFFSGKRDLYQHLQTHSLTSHMRPHSGEKSFKCKICDKCFSSDNYLQQHLEAHAEEKPFKCGTCGMCFARMIYLTNHMRTHSGEKTFNCEICEKCFISEKYLGRHIRTHSIEKPLKCDFCKKCFTDKNYFNQHLKVHSGEKPFKCGICDLSFNFKGNLNSHMITHSSEKPFKCGICEARFTRKRHLIIHFSIHSTVKPFKCNICEKCYTHGSHLNVHMRIHSGEKRFACEVCKKSFRQKSHLNLHKRTHCGEKPYRCGTCDKCFSQKKTLSKHFCDHPGEKISNKSIKYKARLKQMITPHETSTTPSCSFCTKSPEGCVCSTNLKDNKMNSLVESNFMLECQLCFEKISCKFQLEMHLQLHDGDYKCVICSNDYRNCSCSDVSSDSHNDSLTENTVKSVIKVEEEKKFPTIIKKVLRDDYKCLSCNKDNNMNCNCSANYVKVTEKTSESPNDFDEPLREETIELVRIKEEIIDPFYESFENFEVICMELSEDTVPKQEVKGEYFEIGSNSLEVDEDTKAINLKQEPTEF